MKSECTKRAYGVVEPRGRNKQINVEVVPALWEPIHRSRDRRALQHAVVNDLCMQSCNGLDQEMIELFHVSHHVHVPRGQLLTLKGPLRASISIDGVVVENAKAALAGAGSCAAPVVSTFQGGIVSRGTAMKTMSVPLRPSIAVVNRSAQPIRKIALWDSDSQRILMTFDRTAARPILDEGQSYLLVVERNDGSEVRVTLQPSASTQADPLILVVR